MTAIYAHQFLVISMCYTSRLVITWFFVYILNDSLVFYSFKFHPFRGCHCCTNNARCYCTRKLVQASQGHPSLPHSHATKPCAQISRTCSQLSSTEVMHGAPHLQPTLTPQWRDIRTHNNPPSLVQMPQLNFLMPTTPLLRNQSTTHTLS